MAEYQNIFTRVQVQRSGSHDGVAAAQRQLGPVLASQVPSHACWA